MNKALYISSLIFSVLFGIIIIYYIEVVQTVRYSYFYSSYSSGSSVYDSGINETEEAGWISLFFFLFFITTFLLGLIRIKRVTNKVLSMIGLSLSALFVLWDLVMLSSPGSLSFDEVGIGFLFFVPVVTAFSIVGIVQANRFKRQGALYKQPMESDLLDS